MSIEKRLKATAKNIEGKAQEVAGKVTGDPEEQSAGKVKQTEASARHALEDAKDKIKKALD